MQESRHLDLGCGNRARNPYKQDLLIGCDLVAMEQLEPIRNFRFMAVDLASHKLPFADSEFDSVSAFDFIEHVSRQAYDKDGSIFSPFIRLMSEIHRILRPDGVFLASTPAYPRPEAFQDPTHVNIITDRTHEYFCGNDPYASRYGFVGRFEVIKVAWEPQKNLFDERSGKIRKWYRKNVEYRFFKGGFPHLTWELKAIK